MVKTEVANQNLQICLEFRCVCPNQLCEDERLSRDYGIRNQICRAAVLTMSKIAEGFGRGNSTDFIRSLDMARGSAIEIQSLLYAALARLCTILRRERGIAMTRCKMEVAIPPSMREVTADAPLHTNSNRNAAL